MNFCNAFEKIFFINDININDENELQIVLHEFNITTNQITTTKFQFKTFMQCTKCQ